MNENLIKKVQKLCEQPLKEMGISIYHLEFVNEGGEDFLRFFIDKEDGVVDLDVCVEVSEVVGRILDEHDPIKSPYNLEVSSSGAEKPLLKEEHFKKALGKYVHFDLKEAFDGKHQIEGVLVGINEESYELDVKIKTQTKKYKISKDLVEQARLAIKF